MDKDGKTRRPEAVDVERMVDRLQCSAAAVEAVEADMSWYGKACRRMRRHTALYVVAAGLLAVVLALALLPALDYGYMVGDRASAPQEVCDNMYGILEKV